MHEIERRHLSTLQHHSKEELAYRELRAAILSNVLKPGERIMPQQLADRFCVSTMPVRQALMRLESERLVLRMPNRGLMVAPLSMKEVGDIYTLRVALEGVAARLAATRLGSADLDSLGAMLRVMEVQLATGQVEKLVETNTHFHFTIYRAADNDQLYDILQNLWDLSSRYRGMYYGEPSVPETTLREHQGILAALQRKDADEADRLVRSDMEETAKVLLALIAANINQREGEVNGDVPLV